MPLKDSGLMSLGPHQHERQWWPRAVHEQGLELPQARSQEISPDFTSRSQGITEWREQPGLVLIGNVPAIENFSPPSTPGWILPHHKGQVRSHKSCGASVLSQPLLETTHLQRAGMKQRLHCLGQCQAAVGSL